MPAPLTAINNTYTANTPKGVRECLRFLKLQGRDGSRREEGEALRSFPVSIVYGFGSFSVDASLVMKGDELDIVPTRWDTVRRRRWWDVSRDASKQMLLPFPEHARIRIIHINRYNNSTDLVIQVGPDRDSQLNLVAPRNMNSPPGLHTVRAIRIHNVDGSETVPPMRTTANSAFYQQSQQVRGIVEEERGPGADLAVSMSDYVFDYDEVPPMADREVDWHTAVEPCPRRPSGDPPEWMTSSPPSTRPRGPRGPREPHARTVSTPITENVTREVVGILPPMPRDIIEAQNRAVRRTGLDNAREGIGDESCRLIPVVERIENFRRAWSGVNLDMGEFTDQVETHFQCSQAIDRCARNNTT